MVCTDCHTSGSQHRGGAIPTACTDSEATRAPFVWGARAKGGTGWDGAVDPTYNYTTQTCNNYCHGAFPASGVTGNVTWNSTVTCGGCHLSPPPVGGTGKYHPQNTNCAACHLTGTTQANMTGAALTAHVDGKMDRNTTNDTGCTQCHGNLAVKPVPNLPTDTRAAPGLSGQVDSKGNAYTSTTVAGVGAHLAHLGSTFASRGRWSSVFKCTECHPAGAAYPDPGYVDSTHADGNATPTTAVPFPTGSISRQVYSGVGGNPVPSGTTAVTCANTFCHGQFTGGKKANTVPWNTAGLVGSSMTCTSCHGAPPYSTDGSGDTNHGTTGNTACYSCHGAGYCGPVTDATCTAAGITGAAVATHVDGQVKAALATKCKGCHASRTGATGALRAAVYGAAWNPAAPIEGDDFVRPSRHVSNGLSGSDIVKNTDCVLCHLEGTLASTDAQPVLDSTYHGGSPGGLKTVDLRNVDAPGNTPAGNTPVVSWTGHRLDANGNPQGNGGIPNGTTYTAMRDGMDRFCMGCHDANGASAVTVSSDGNSLVTIGVTRQMMPFNGNANVKNAFEVAAVATWRMSAAGQNNQVLNVKGDVGSLYGFGNNSATPAPGTTPAWASHHNLRQFNKRYASTNLPTAVWTTTPTKEGENLQVVGEKAGLHCSDCHLNEANAHGSRNNWYMTVNASGMDGGVVNSAGGAATNTDVCARCHAATVYGDGGTGSRTLHTSCGKWQGNLTVPAYLGGNTTVVTMQCLTCHAGGYPGAIHGVNKPYVPYGQAGKSTHTYRFLGSDGSAWHADGNNQAYNPNNTVTFTGDSDWQVSGSTVTCYTPSLNTFAGCAKHTSPSTKPTLRARNISY